jgi:hypothetical protein
MQAMLTIQGSPHRLCDGIARRDFLRAGALGGLGLKLPHLVGAARAGQGMATAFGRARRCIQLFLTGGPSQLDTWDLKPNAPVEIRGEFKPIATNVPGISLGEYFSRLARCADRYCLLRSVTHADATHPTAGYTMLTGVVHPNAGTTNLVMTRPSPTDHPHLGSLLTKTRTPRRGVPTFASLPEVVKDDAVNEFPGQVGGLLGKQCDPLRIETDATRKRFVPPEIVLPPDVTAGRLGDRRRLLQALDQGLAALDTSKSALADLDGSYQKAYSLIGSGAFLRAFELDREADRLRAAYGPHLFGQGCLLARRLLEAGVSLVSVYWHYEGPADSPVWDTHDTNFPYLRNRLIPPADAAISSLLTDLAERGLLDDTVVYCLGEFGRSPRINRKGGREHWPGVQTVLLAGAGIRGGSVYGASDKDGAYPADQAVTPADLAATVLHLLGVPADLEVQDRLGRPVRACTGTSVQGLCS